MFILSIIFGIIVSILVFWIIILIHEYGHFKTARIFWVKVEEFWLGIPPKARKLFTDKHGTEYTLNWLPIWGFVRLKWENIHSFSLYDEKKQLLSNETLQKALETNLPIYDKNRKLLSQELREKILSELKQNQATDSLVSKPYYQQAIIVLAGIVMNFILAAVIFSFLFFIWVSPVGINNKIETSLPLKLIPNEQQAIERWILTKNWWIILYPLEWSIAEKSGIKSGDILHSIITCTQNVQNFVECEWNEQPQGYEISSPEDAMKVISENAGKEVALYINQIFLDEETTNPSGGQYIKVHISDEGKIWSYLAENISVNRDFKYKYGFFGSIKAGVQETYGQIFLTFQGIKMLWQKIFAPETPQERQEAIEQVAGPIGMVDFMTRSLGNGFIFILILWAIISVNLWVFNLLPIPALDGGRFLFIAINGTIKTLFWKKAINEKLEWSIHVLFFLFLIALSIIIAYNDVTKIIDR